MRQRNEGDDSHVKPDFCGFEHSVQNTRIVLTDSSWNVSVFGTVSWFQAKHSLGLVRLFQVEDRPISLPGLDQVDPTSLKSGPSSFRTYDGPFLFWA